MSIRERTLSDGTVVYQARRFMGYKHDGTPDQRSVTCRTRRQAELEEAKMQAEADAMRGRSGRMTLSQYIDMHYWPVASKRLAATSLDTYEREIRLRIKPSLGNADIRNIDRKRIQKMVDRTSTRDVGQKAVSVLKTILNEAKGDGVIQSNPAEATFAYPAKGRKRDNGIVLTTFSEIADMLEVVRENGNQSVQRIAYTGLLQGMRPEERYALEWADVDLERQCINVDKARISASAKHGGVQDKETKTDESTRIIPMHPWFHEWLLDVPRGDGAFIKGADGKAISPSTAQKRWKRFLDDNKKVPKVTIENMRHSFATSYLHAGGNVADLSLILGHSDINTTLRRYVRPNVDDLRRGMMAVAECK